jgi:protein gp37
MAEQSSIEWTDATWNPITGCSVISPGCTNCYAMKLAGTRLKFIPSRKGLTIDTKAGPVWNGEVRFNMEWIELPLNWGRPRRVFVCAHGDLFHEAVPMDWIAWVYGVAIAAVHLRGHTFQVLTKRSDRAREVLASEAFWDAANAYASSYVMDAVDAGARRSDDARATLDDYGPTEPPPGIWLGVSAEDQPRLEQRLRDLLATAAAVRFLSLEPLLGPMDVLVAGIKINGKLDRETGERRYVDWVIVGGESGAGARPMHPDWARQIRDDCETAGVPFFFKQWGEWTPGENAGPITGPQECAWWINGAWDIGRHSKASLESFTAGDEPDLFRVGKRAAGRLLDGVTHDAFPAEAGR